MNRARRPDLICLSHLRWNFVFQRPQHLMVRFARERRVFFVEEPIFDAATPRLESAISQGVQVVVPHLPPDTSPDDAVALERHLLRTLCDDQQIASATIWLYTPLAWPIADALPRSSVVYDCMDELSGFAGAAPDLRDRERELLARVDLVFTGGYSLFEAKRELHDNVHPFPSSVDVQHFGRARMPLGEPADQQTIPHPRIGYCGVIDERMDLDLVRSLAAAQRDWQFVLIGPVTKISEASLPRAANLHYLGMKRYQDLPAYLSGWDVAMLPFARNDATRFVSPTKTPEYLAAGCPVVSTSIRDVVRPYGALNLAWIADTPPEFAAAIAAALSEGRSSARRADPLLATMSWDKTWAAMNELVGAIEHRRQPAAERVASPARLRPSIDAARA